MTRESQKGFEPRAKEDVDIVDEAGSGMYSFMKAAVVGGGLCVLEAVGGVYFTVVCTLTLPWWNSLNRVVSSKCPSSPYCVHRTGQTSQWLLLTVS